MKQDYLVYHSMIGVQAGVIWSYNDTHLLNVSVNQCDDSFSSTIRPNMLFLVNGINGLLLVDNEL